jgi:hypothetical protein
MRRLILASLAAAGLAAAGATDTPPVPYPDGYRAWTHVKSMVIREGHPLYASFGGIHHLYANAKALEGYRTGRFPDGSVIVFDLLEAEDGGNALTEGPRKVVGVMHKDAKRWGGTGGWGFEGFAAGDPARRAAGAAAATACFACHRDAKADDYVFSRWRD